MFCNDVNTALDKKLPMFSDCLSYKTKKEEVKTSSAHCYIIALLKNDYCFTIFFMIVLLPFITFT